MAQDDDGSDEENVDESTGTPDLMRDMSDEELEQMQRKFGNDNASDTQ